MPLAILLLVLSARTPRAARSDRARQGVPAVSCATGSHPRRTDTREASRWPAPQGTDSTEPGDGAPCSSDAVLGRAAGLKERRVQMLQGLQVQTTAPKGVVNLMKDLC